MDNTREKLIDVFIHIGDHIRSLDEYGFCFDSALAKAIEDVVAMLKNQDANGVTLDNQVSSSKWIPVTERLPDRQAIVIAYYPTMCGTSGEMQIHKAWAMSDTCTHWMPLAEAPKEVSE